LINKLRQKQGDKSTMHTVRSTTTCPWNSHGLCCVFVHFIRIWKLNPSIRVWTWQLVRRMCMTVQFPSDNWTCSQQSKQTCTHFAKGIPAFLLEQHVWCKYQLRLPTETINPMLLLVQATTGQLAWA